MRACAVSCSPTMPKDESPSIMSQVSLPLAASGFLGVLHRIWPGLLLCGLIALAAQFLSEHYGAPAMLMALLIGLSMHFVVEDGQRCAPGVQFSAQTVLRAAVALLGLRISFSVLGELGLGVVAVLGAGLVLTIIFGLIFAKLMGQGWRIAILTSGAVAICGASAAMAISAILPKSESGERDLGFTVFGVTLLSTLAMILYPILAVMVGLDTRLTGIFLGGTIHDVAQVVGAGFSVSDEVGEAAATVKLLRVSFLAPFVLVLSVVIRAAGGEPALGTKKPPVLPGFIIAFVILAVGNSLLPIPQAITTLAWDLSKWGMLAAIAAVGVKTELRRALEIPLTSVLLILGETVFIAAVVLGASLRFL